MYVCVQDYSPGIFVIYYASFRVLQNQNFKWILGYTWHFIMWLEKYCVRFFSSAVLSLVFVNRPWSALEASRSSFDIRPITCNSLFLCKFLDPFGFQFPYFKNGDNTVSWSMAMEQNFLGAKSITLWECDKYSQALKGNKHEGKKQKSLG